MSFFLNTPVSKDVAVLVVSTYRKINLLLDSRLQVNFMEGCWQLRYWMKEATSDSELKNRKQSSMYLRYKVGLNSLGSPFNYFHHYKTKTIQLVNGKCKPPWQFACKIYVEEEKCYLYYIGSIFHKIVSSWSPDIGHLC